MRAADFELNVVLPPDARFAETMRNLAAHAARYAGCADDAAAAYGEAVEHVVRVCLGQYAPGGHVPVIVRRDEGPLEFLIACEETFDPVTRHAGIRVNWTREHGGSMCRVALDP